jgi:hypothetical protein
MMRAISTSGLPLKIQAEWTDTDYWNRRSNYNDDLDVVNVKGWQIRINGQKYPRGHTDGEGYPDWTYRYTPQEGNSEKGKRKAIENALQDARLTVW